MTDFSAIQTEHQFRAHAIAADAMTDRERIQFNVPANVIMLLDAAKNMGTQPDLEAIRLEAESWMLQLALLNEGCNPGSVFLNQAVEAGWRYRGDLGFFKENA